MKKNQSIQLKNVSSYFVGGENKTISGAGVRNVSYSLSGVSRPYSIDGDYEYGQMYVQVYEQAQARYQAPLLMWHGGGMTGTVWESTANGEPGWLDYFLKEGYSVYVSDAVERGRSGFDPTAVMNGTPLFRSKQEAWELFRIGTKEGYCDSAEERIPFPGAQFPAASFDFYCRSFVPRFEGNRGQIVAAYKQMIGELPESIIMAHSQGGGFALQVVSETPLPVKAVVAVEPSGAPELTDDVDWKAVGKIPHLIVWGDHFEQHKVWQSYRSSVDRYVDKVRKNEGNIDVISLPSIGISGNSHCPMSDLNSEQVADVIAAWLREKL